MARREHIDDAAAGAPLSDLDHGVDALVAGALERLEQELAVQGVAPREPQCARREVRRRGDFGVERRGGHDDHRRLAGGEAPADDGALGVGLPLPPAPPEPGLAPRELDRGRAEESEILGPAMGVGRRLHEDERGARVGLEELGDGESAGGSGQPGDAQAGRERPTSPSASNEPAYPTTAPPRPTSASPSRGRS